MFSNGLLLISIVTISSTAGNKTQAFLHEDERLNVNTVKAKQESSNTRNDSTEDYMIYAVGSIMTQRTVDVPRYPVGGLWTLRGNQPNPNTRTNKTEDKKPRENKLRPEGSALLKEITSGLTSSLQFVGNSKLEERMKLAVQQVLPKLKELKGFVGNNKETAETVLETFKNVKIICSIDGLDPRIKIGCIRSLYTRTCGIYTFRCAPGMSRLNKDGIFLERLIETSLSGLD